jgi:hypothetical protein
MTTRMNANHQHEDIRTQSGRARDILEKKIETGRAAAMQVFERINREAPRDAIAKGQAIHFGVADYDNMENPAIGLSLGSSEECLGIHKHALGQFAGRAGIPSAYLAELAGAEFGSWKRNLATEILSRHYHDGEKNSRFLVRQVGTQVRGFLSDKYRRLDSRPLIEAFAAECAKVGAVPVDGTMSDTRVTMKALIPRVYEPVPGEVIALGIEWGNSDFGAALHSVRAFILRVWCLNGAVMENALAQVHLGRGISDDIELSQKTYELDTRASISALRDVVAGTLSEKAVNALCAGIQRADEEKVEWRSVSSKLGKKLLKSEMEEARKAFESDDVVNLPAGKSVWRVSNALSWLAGHTEDPDRKLELQRFAGEVIHGRAEAAVAA